MKPNPQCSNAACVKRQVRTLVKPTLQAFDFMIKVVYYPVWLLLFFLNKASCVIIELLMLCRESIFLQSQQEMLQQKQSWKLKDPRLKKVHCMMIMNGI